MFNGFSTFSYAAKTFLYATLTMHWPLICWQIWNWYPVEFVTVVWTSQTFFYFAFGFSLNLLSFLFRTNTVSCKNCFAHAKLSLWPELWIPSLETPTALMHSRVGAKSLVLAPLQNLGLFISGLPHWSGGTDVRCFSSVFCWPCHVRNVLCLPYVHCCVSTIHFQPCAFRYFASAFTCLPLGKQIE